MPRADCHVSRRALTGGPESCGDAGFSVTDGDTCFAALVDALGHGPEAARVADQAMDWLAVNHSGPLDELMTRLHEHLKGTRGAVAFLCRLHLPTGDLEYCGMGNIGARIHEAEGRRSLVSKDGVLGYMISTPRAQSARMALRDILALCSDGVRTNFEPYEYPALLRGDAQQVCANMLDTLAKGDDDASCLVLRYLR